MRWGSLQLAATARLPLLTCIAAMWWASASYGATVTFEPDVVPLGTRYGGAFGQTPGETVFTQDGIGMSVERLITGSTSSFVRVEVGGRFASFFDSTPIELDQIAVAFTFTGLAFDVTSVTLEVRDFGGISNFSVNGAAPLQLDALGDIPAIVAPGISATLLPDRDDPQRIQLFSQPGVAIERFLIGGQELALDNVTAVPEPTSLLLLGLATAAVVRSRRRSN